MEITITEFRRQLFRYVDHAREGAEVWIRHKGERFRLAPEKRPLSRIEMATPIHVMVDRHDPDFSKVSAALLTEMEAEWEAEWNELYRPNRRKRAAK